VQNRHAEVYWSSGVWPCHARCMQAWAEGRARVARRVRIDRVLPPLGPQMRPAVAIHRCQRHCVLQEAIQCSCKAFLAEFSKPQVTSEVS
jgi:hypothetical protein